MESKTVLRYHALKRRRLAYPVERAAWLAALTDDDVPVLAPLLPPPGALVAAFEPMGFEPPADLLIERILAAGLHVIVPDSSSDSQPHPPNDEGGREGGSPPPAGSPTGQASHQGLATIGWKWVGGGPTLPADTLAGVETIVVPAVAVDETGTRLGRGGGWYDRALKCAGPGVPILAMVNPEELYPPGAIPREEHDIPVTHALLPTSIRRLCP